MSPSTAWSLDVGASVDKRMSLTIRMKTLDHVISVSLLNNPFLCNKQGQRKPITGSLLKPINLFNEP